MNKGLVYPWTRGCSRPSLNFNSPILIFILKKRYHRYSSTNRFVVWSYSIEKYLHIWVYCVYTSYCTYYSRTRKGHREIMKGWLMSVTSHPISLPLSLELLPIPLTPFIITRQKYTSPPISKSLSVCRAAMIPRSFSDGIVNNFFLAMKISLSVSILVLIVTS